MRAQPWHWSGDESRYLILGIWVYFIEIFDRSVVKANKSGRNRLSLNQVVHIPWRYSKRIPCMVSTVIPFGRLGNQGVLPLQDSFFGLFQVCLKTIMSHASLKCCNDSTRQPAQMNRSCLIGAIEAIKKKRHLCKSCQYVCPIKCK